LIPKLYKLRYNIYDPYQEIKMSEIDIEKALNNVSQQFALHSIHEGSNSSRDNRYIRGSSAGFCSRKLGYGVLGYQATPTDGHGQFILNMGNSIHDYIQLQLVKMGWIKAAPFWNEDHSYIDWKQTDDPDSGCELDIIDHENRILGHLDGITVPMLKVGNLYLPSMNSKAERYLIEIKSISDKPSFWVKGFKDGGRGTLDASLIEEEFIEIDVETQKSGKMQQRLSKFSHSRMVKVTYAGGKSFEYPVYKVKVDGAEQFVTVTMIGNSAGQFTQLLSPKPAHVAQASLYADFYGIKKILFLYVGKDVDSRNYEDTEDLLNWPIKILEHTVDPGDVDLLKRKFTKIYSYTDQGELPPRDYDNPGVKDAECPYCPYKWTCFPETVNREELSSKFSRLGLIPLTDGANTMHVAATGSLEEEFRNKRPK
jgi:hypothetical protein